MSINETKKKFTFNKSERLKSRKLIEGLFREGKSVSSFPLKVLYSIVSNEPSVLQAGVTCSSRSFRKAVDRNRIKRVLREAYRLQKLPLQTLLSQQKQSAFLFFIYTGKTILQLEEVYKKMESVLKQLSDKIQKLS